MYKGFKVWADWKGAVKVYGISRDLRFMWHYVALGHGVRDRGMWHFSRWLGNTGSVNWGGLRVWATWREYWRGRRRRG
jgi:hypothetical protein